MRVPAIITLTTDFGPGEYVAAMKGVILTINPQALIVDISHQVEPQDILGGAFVLAAATPHFPPNTIHVAVVDPGVGTGRRALLVETPQARFLAPDNGLLGLVLEGKPASGGRAWELTQPRYWRQEVSATFHGRDIFAPAAAHLSLGVSPQEMGRPVTEMVKALLPPVEMSAGEVVRGQVVYVDRFGNLITNLRREHLPAGGVRVEVAGRTIRDLSTHYQTGPALSPTKGGEILALIGSSGYLEVAAPGASAARLLRVGRGVRVVVRSA